MTETKVARASRTSPESEEDRAAVVSLHADRGRMAVVSIAGLGVALRPSFAETRPDGMHEIVRVKY
ncbi:hypothetical protein JN535_19075 [Cellulosimicrobium cellulans]|nr:hypothetical protein [Cellulosimicrobium cellulans]